MILTEDEARKKQCRIAAPVNSAPAVGGLGAYSQNINWCIASGCMHWRWGPNEYQLADGVINVIKRGYCGLAGAPKHDL